VSLFGSIGNVLKKVGRTAVGFATGGVGGAVAAAIGPGNPAKTKNLNPKLSAQREAMRGGQIVGAPAVVPNVAQYSASPIARLASTALAPMPTIPALVAPGGGYSGGGATGSWTPAAGTPMWAYRRLYTKKGTPRRTRRDGMPYAVPRMNPMNVRAARRAVRRIRGARKLLQRIERTLPKAHVRRRAA
jgi:hypothetical protein